jgi:branched-subunit amino acid transport protein
MIFWTIVAMGLVTFGIRIAPILLLERWEMPANIEQALRFVPIAVLTAIILPEMLQHSGTLDLSLSNFRMIAGIIAIVVAWRTKSVLATLAVGMGVLWLLASLWGG